MNGKKYQWFKTVVEVNMKICFYFERDQEVFFGR